MNEYEKKLEQENDELREQLARVSFHVKPFFKILKDENSDTVKALQLFLKTSEGLDPYSGWTTDDITQTFMSRPVYERNILISVELQSSNNWKGVLYFLGENHPDSDDNNIEFAPDTSENIMSKMLKVCGLTGFNFESYEVKFVTAEERMKPFVNKVTDILDANSSVVASAKIFFNSNPKNTWT